MAYLDETGLARFWYDIKQWIASALSNLVHRTGHESIAGRKLFVSHQTYDPQDGWDLASRVIVKTEDITRGATPAETKYLSFDYEDSTYDVANDQGDDNPRLASVEYVHYASGAYVMKLMAVNHSNSSDLSQLRAGFDQNGIKFADAPSTSSQRNSATDIVTRDWIPRDTRIVHATGNETIDGAKNFVSSVNVKHPYARGTNPSSASSYKQFNFLDSSGEDSTTKRAGCIESQIDTNGRTSIYMRVYNWVAGSTSTYNISIHYPKDGTPYTQAPTPSDVDDNSTKIATTAWAFPRITKYYTSVQSASLDLNDFKTPGSYYFQGSGSNYVANIPFGINGMLVVIAPDIFIVKQIFFRYGTLDSNDHFTAVRTYSVANNVWSSWARLLTNKDTIPVANGGTGQTTVANIQAGKDGNGNTISSTYLPLSGGTMSGSITRNGGLALSGTTSGNIFICNGTSASDGGGIWLNGKNHSNQGLVRLQAYNGTYRQLDCQSDGTLKWNGQTVQTTSDERLKTPLESVPDDVLDAWSAVRWGQFQFLDAVEEKGSSARLHVGLIAQAVDRAFASENLDVCRYGILCHEVRDAEGEVPAIEQWMARYTEALCMEAAYMRRENVRLKKRVADLEERLAALELKVS